MNTARDEVECGTTIHFDRGPAVMRQDEHRPMIWRILPPPTVPRVVGPLAADRTEHVATHDPRAYPLAETARHIVVDSDFTAGRAVNPLNPLRVDVPPVKFFASHSEGRLQCLVRTRAIAVQRYR